MIRKLLGGLIVGWLLFAAVWVGASGCSRNEVMLNAACDPTRKPRILFLADRNKLVDAPKGREYSVEITLRKVEGIMVLAG